MTEPSKIYRVAFRKRRKGVHYFGSLAAIYDSFTDDDIGCKVTRLWAVKIKPGSPYRNKLCTISQEVLIRKKTQRGIK